MKKIKSFLIKYKAIILMFILLLMLIITLYKGVYGFSGVLVIIIIIIISYINNNRKVHYDNEKKLISSIIEINSMIWKLFLAVFILNIFFYLTPKIFNDTYYVRISDLPIKLVNQGYSKLTIESMFSEYIDEINNSANSPKKLETSPNDKIKVEFFGNSLYIDELVLLSRKFFNKEKLISIDIGIDSSFIVSRVNVKENEENNYTVEKKRWNYNLDSLSYKMEGVTFTAAYDALVYIDAPKIVSYYTWSKPYDFENLSHLMKGSDFINRKWYNKLSKNEKFEVNINYSISLILHEQFKDAKKHLYLAQTLASEIDFSNENNSYLLMDWNSKMIEIGEAKKSLEFIKSLKLKDRNLLNFLLSECNLHLGETELALNYLEKVGKRKSKLFKTDMIKQRIGFLNFLLNNFNSVKNTFSIKPETQLLLSLIEDFQGSKLTESGIIEHTLKLKNYTDDLNNKIKELANENLVHENYPTSHWKALVNMNSAAGVEDLTSIYDELKVKGIKSTYLDLLYIIRIGQLDYRSIFTSKKYISPHELKMKSFRELVKNSNSEIIKYSFLEEMRLMDEEYSSTIDSLNFKSEILQDFKKLCLLELNEELSFDEIERFRSKDYYDESLNSFKEYLSISFIRELGLDNWYPVTNKNIDKFRKVAELIIEYEPGDYKSMIAYGSMLERFNLNKEAKQIYIKAKMQTNLSELDLPFEVLKAEQNKKDFLFLNAIDKHFNLLNKNINGNNKITDYEYYEQLMSCYILDLAYSNLNKCDIQLTFKKYNNFKYMGLASNYISSKELMAETYEKEAIKWLNADEFDNAIFFFTLLFSLTDEFTYTNQSDYDFYLKSSLKLKEYFENIEKILYFKNKKKQFDDIYYYDLNIHEYSCFSLAS